MSLERDVSRELQSGLREIESTLRGGILGVSARFLPTGETVHYNADEVFPTASVIKAAIVAEWLTQVAEGKLDEGAVESLPPDSITGGSGVLGLLSGVDSPGLALPLRDLALLAIAVSDNTASNRVLAQVGGPAAVNRRLQGDWGMTGTTVHRPISFNLGPSDPPYTATTVPRDMMVFLSAVGEGRLHNPEVSRKVRDILEKCQDKELLPRYLAVNPYASDLHEAPPPFTVAHKSGAVNGVRNDVALITSGDRHLIISAYSKGCPDLNWTPANTGAEAIARVGKLLCERFFV